MAMEIQSREAYDLFVRQQTDRGMDVDTVKEALKALKVETPSWGYGDSGTRFNVYKKVGVPRNAFEKIDDAAVVHRLTGMAPSVAIHIPWDKVDNYAQLKAHAENQGVHIGAVNPNLFQDDDYMLGSLCNSNPVIRRKAIRHLLECVDVAKAVHSDIISLWIADGTSYPGQADIRKRKHWLKEAFEELYEALSSDMRMLIEYKFFEPAFYHTDLADWGMAYHLATQLGPKAQVLVDTGHHAQGTNVEHIVAYLLDEQKLGGFHFNSRKYADDDLMVGSHNPYEIFLIFFQIIDAARDENAGVRKTTQNIAYMIDQSHVIEPKIPAMIRSLLNVQTQYAKALLINLDEVRAAQDAQDVLAAENAVRTAYEFDVSPLLQVVREELGVPVDPMQAYLSSEYPKNIIERGIGGSSW